MTNNCLTDICTFETFNDKQIHEISNSIFREVSESIKQVVEDNLSDCIELKTETTKDSFR